MVSRRTRRWLGTAGFYALAILFMLPTVSPLLALVRGAAFDEHG